MIRVALTDAVFRHTGYCSYQDYCLESHSNDPYDLDRWELHVDQIGFVCNAAKELIEIGGYLPHANWKRVENIIVPTVVEDRNFVIKEPFDSSGRIASVDAPQAYCEADSGKGIARFVLDDTQSGSVVYASPHEHLIVEAVKLGDDILSLSSVFFLNIEHFPMLSRD